MTLSYIYTFKGEGAELQYSITLDERTLDIAPRNNPEQAPPWTFLSFKQCEHCPLDAELVKHCPIALNLYDLLVAFGEMKSIDVFEVRIDGPQRTYLKNTDLQEGLQSIFGLIMATSGCPHLAFLKPVARFHLPFATYEETLFRSLGNYFIGRFLTADLAREAVGDIEDLLESYRNVEETNSGLLQRVSSIIDQGGDADRNAIVILDGFAKLLGLEHEEDFSTLSFLYAPRDK